MKEFGNAILATLITLLIVLAISAVVIDTVEIYALIGFVFVFAILLLAMVAALGVIEVVIIWGVLKIKEAIKKKNPKCDYHGKILSFKKLKQNYMDEFGWTEETANMYAKMYVI